MKKTLMDWPDICISRIELRVPAFIQLATACVSGALPEVLLLFNLLHQWLASETPGAEWRSGIPTTVF